MSAALDPIDRSFRIRSRLDTRSRDPLTYFRFGTPRVREALSLFAVDEPISELHMRACNKGGKTLAKAMYIMACLQKRQELDGALVPQWRGPVEALQLVLDYPQQLLSVKPAYLRALGGWPGHVTPNGEYLSSIRVMPVGGDPDDDSEWSVIHFLSQKNVDSGRGARTDIIDFDEPPKMDFLDELRKAGHAGRRSIRIIGETPLKRREWAPLRADYGDSPRSAIRRVDQYRAECRWSLSEVPDWILSPAEKAELRSNWARSAQPLAREHGDYENTDGKCPFDVDTIVKMMAAWCRPPELRKVNVPMESATGEPSIIDMIRVQVWRPPQPKVEGYQDIDPASGVDDNAHNPAGLHLSDAITGELWVRWNGYLAPHSVGAMAAALHRHYNKCHTDIEMQDHWGPNVVRGYSQNDGTNLCYEERELTPGKFAKEVGFAVKHATRAIWVSCIQEWIAAFKAGLPYAICPSREVFECLLDMELDDRGLVVAGPGIAHAEDFVLLGQKLRRIRRATAVTPQVYTPPKTENQRIAAMIRGEVDDDDREPEQLTPTMERPRW